MRSVQSNRRAIRSNPARSGSSACNESCSFFILSLNCDLWDNRLTCEDDLSNRFCQVPMYAAMTLFHFKIGIIYARNNNFKMSRDLSLLFGGWYLGFLHETVICKKMTTKVRAENLCQSEMTDRKSS